MVILANQGMAKKTTEMCMGKYGNERSFVKIIWEHLLEDGKHTTSGHQTVFSAGILIKKEKTTRICSSDSLHSDTI